ncbi:MAG: GNAT family N-acetyltransferase [Nitrospira sp.]|nr:GNAT family N-acetyltransferase [Nitrospira sp.]
MIEVATIIYRLGVAPAFQGKGFVRQLMDYVENYVRHHRYAGIRLDAYSENPRALALYFRDVDTTKQDRSCFPVEGCRSHVLSWD